MSQASISSEHQALAWYDDDLVLQAEACDVLEKYSGIEAAETKQHVLTMRDKLWGVFPYPCVGEFGFLDMNLCRRASYPQLLSKLKGDPSVQHLDIGCCVGQDLRRLVHDGVSSEQMVGIELEPAFIQLGYELFRDTDRMKARFVILNMLDDNNTELDALDKRFDTIHIGQVLHLFSLEEQRTFLRRVIRLSKPQPGTLIVGHCLGHVDGTHMVGALGKIIMRHNTESWTVLWDELMTETGTGWILSTDLDTQVGYGPRHTKWRDPRWRRLVFELRRV